MFEFSEETIKAFKAFLGLVGISALAAISRSIVSEDRRTFAAFMRGLVLAVFVAWMVGGVADATELSEGWKRACIGGSAFVADDILLFIINLTRKLRDDPSAVIDWIFRRKN